MATTKGKPTTLVVPTQNDQTFTVTGPDDALTVRIAKDGHNRGIAKLSVSNEEALLDFLLARQKARKS